MPVGQTKTKKRWIYTGEPLNIFGETSPTGKAQGAGGLFSARQKNPTQPTTISRYKGVGSTPTISDLFKKGKKTSAPKRGGGTAGRGVLQRQYLPAAPSVLPPTGSPPMPGSSVPHAGGSRAASITGQPASPTGVGSGVLKGSGGGYGAGIFPKLPTGSSMPGTPITAKPRSSKITAQPASPTGVGSGVLKGSGGGYGAGIFPKLPTGSSMPGTPYTAPIGRGAGMGDLRRYEGRSRNVAPMAGGAGMGALRMYENPSAARPEPPASPAPSVAAKVAPQAAPKATAKEPMVESFKRRYPEVSKKANKVFASPSGRRGGGKITAKPKTTKITARVGPSPSKGTKITAKPSGIVGKAKNWWENLSPGWKLGLAAGAGALAGYGIARATEDDEGDYYGGGNTYYTRNYYYGGGRGRRRF